MPLNEADSRTQLIDPKLKAVGWDLKDPSLSTPAVRNWLQARCKRAVNEASLNQADVKALRVPLPPLPEQRCIAEILDTADEAIRQTERVIAKLKAVKAGLLHDLLTRGLDEHGRLRDPVASPEQFKDSPLRRIPRDWKITTLGDVVSRYGGLIQTGPFGSQLHAEEYTTEGIPVIMPQDILDGKVSELQIARIPLGKARELARHRVVPNDMVFSRRGDLSRCTLTLDGGRLAGCVAPAAYSYGRLKPSLMVSGLLVSIDTTTARGKSLPRQLVPQW